MIDEITLVNTNLHLRVFVGKGRIESNLFIKKYLSTDVIDKSSDYLIFIIQKYCNEKWSPISTRFELTGQCVCTTLAQ